MVYIPAIVVYRLDLIYLSLVCDSKHLAQRGLTQKRLRKNTLPVFSQVTLSIIINLIPYVNWKTPELHHLIQTLTALTVMGQFYISALFID